LEGLRNTTKPSLNTVGVLAGVQTGNLPEKGQTHYRFNLLTRYDDDDDCDNEYDLRVRGR
jgi:hypothetical protein